MKPAAQHLPGLELATSLLAENTHPGEYAIKLQEALGQAQAALERDTRQHAPLDYAQISESQAVIDQLTAPKDYAPSVKKSPHESNVVGIPGKLVVAAVGGILAWKCAPGIFDLGNSIVGTLLNTAITGFYVFMFGYALWSALVEARSKYLKKFAGAKESKNVETVSDRNRAA